jgi:RND family efflux transporter MFP subunit
MPSPTTSVSRAGSVLALAALTFASAACRGNAPAQGAAAPPPTAVQTITLKSAPLEDASQFIATVRSLRSTTVQPDVDGILTRILVTAGQRVSIGTPLVQINPIRQEAEVRSTEANRSGLEADVQYWRLQVKRLAALVEAGAVSKAEYDQAAATLQTSEARLTTLDAQVRQGRVELQFYRVTAPQAGVVGDIAVRQGDRVTTSTVITTIDDNESLEAYVQVPLDRAPLLRTGLPLQLLDVDGKVIATNQITFVSPRVDDETQTVLAKSLLKDKPEAVRVLQFVQSRIIWRSRPGLTAPITAVTRISGQYFCYVAEAGPQGGLVARQRPIEVGEVLGNDYVVTKGLKEGERLIVSGIQKIGDGAPVKAE